MRNFEILRYIKKWKYLIVIVCILGAVLVYQYAMSKQTYTAQTVLRYSNSEASNGLTPSGDSLDVSEIYSSKVITGVLEDLDLNTGADSIRSKCAVEPIIPADEESRKEAILKDGEEYVYHPTDYLVTFSVGSDYSKGYAASVLDSILKNYFINYGEKYINLLYSTETGKLDLEVTEQPEPGNFAKMDVTYMKATISEMYARRMYFDGLNTLTSLATKNKNSFLEAINELVASDTSINNSIGTIKKQLENTTITGIWHYGTLLTHTTNVNDVANNDIPANVGDFYLNSNTFSVYFCVGDDNGNHNWLYIGNLTGSFDYSNYASINSPHFEGIPTAPTPSVSNNSRQVATTEYVRSAIDKYASGDNLEMIDLAEGLRDDVYGKQVVWTVGGNIMNLTLPAPKLTNPTTSEEVKITFDKGIIPFDNTVKKGYLPYNTTSVSFIPITRNKTYINCEFNFDTQHLEFTTSNSIISQDTIDAVETRVWKFSLCYYTVNVVYNDSSEEPASQYVISNYDCDWCINSEKIALPYQTLDMLKTVDKNCIINSINEVVDNASKNQSEVGTLIYALHPDITTYSTLAAKDWYFGKLIKSDVDEVFILNNDRQDDIDYPDGVTLSGKLPYNDEVGYMLSQDIPALKKAFCKVTKKCVASIDGSDGEIEVLLTF